MCHGIFQNYPQGQKPLVYRLKLHFEYIHQVWWVNGHSEPNYVICYYVMALKYNLKSEKCTSAKLKLCCSTSAIHHWPWFSLMTNAKRKKREKHRNTRDHFTYLKSKYIIFLDLNLLINFSKSNNIYFGFENNNWCLIFWRFSPISRKHSIPVMHVIYQSVAERLNFVHICLVFARNCVYGSFSSKNRKKGGNFARVQSVL